MDWRAFRLHPNPRPRGFGSHSQAAAFQVTLRGGKEKKKLVPRISLEGKKEKDLVTRLRKMEVDEPT